LGLKLDEKAALAVQIGGTPDRTPLRGYERAIVAANAKRGMAAYQYDSRTA